MIQDDVVTNSVVWDGNNNTWQPPENAIMLIQAITPAMVWQLNPDLQSYVLVEVIGAGSIGFTWDGTVLTTNQPKPSGLTQPITTGMQTLGA